MIDPFHLEAYGITTVNYNRDVEIFPVLTSIFEQIYESESPYKSPTDMGVNMAGNCIVDDKVCREASKQEIIRRYYAALSDLLVGKGTEETVYKIELLMKPGEDLNGRSKSSQCLRWNWKTHINLQLLQWN